MNAPTRSRRWPSLLGSALVALAASATRVDAAECDVAGDLALQEAETRGFNMTAAKTQGEGYCTPYKFSVLVSAGSDSSVTCSIQFLQGQTLKNNWRILDIWISGGTFKITRPPGNGADGSFEVQATSDRGTTRTVSLSKVRLVGNDCSDWKNAF